MPTEIVNQQRDLLAEYLCHGHQAMMGIFPTGKQQEPLLDDHSDQLDLHFTEDPPRFAARPFIDQRLLLPQLEEQFEQPI